MKKIWTPFFASLIILAALKAWDLHNPIWHLSNDYLIAGHQSTSDFKSTDKIAIVNISDLPLQNIRTQVEIVSQYQPAAIGVDYFVPELDTNYQTISYKKIVLPINIDDSTIHYSANPFSSQAYFGFTESQLHYFDPFVKVKMKICPSLPTQLIQLYDSNLYRKILKRGIDHEVINYLGNTNSFQYLGDLTMIQSIEQLKSLKGKIVLIGYTGVESFQPTDSDTLDSHSTPMGKMFGVVVLANILHTLMNNYIDPLQPKWNYVIAIILTFLCVFISSISSPRSLYIRYLLTKLSQLIVGESYPSLVTFETIKFQL